jgi:pilus biogenesis lipoprotein CpaD
LALLASTSTDAEEATMSIRPPTAAACSVIALLAALLQACAPIEPLPTDTWVPPRIETTETSYRHTVSFDTGQSRLGLSQEAALTAFLAGLPADGRISFVVAGHADERGALGYNAELAQRRAVEVARLIQASGFPDASISVLSRGEQAPLADSGSVEGLALNRRVDIVAEIVEARVLGCPGGTHTLAATPQNYPFPGHGCADLSNLVRMLDDPRDLTVGRATTAADGVRESEAIVRYRTDKLKRLDDVEVSQ